MLLSLNDVCLQLIQHYSLIHQLTTHLIHMNMNHSRKSAGLRDLSQEVQRMKQKFQSSRNQFRQHSDKSLTGKQRALTQKGGQSSDVGFLSEKNSEQQSQNQGHQEQVTFKKQIGKQNFQSTMVQRQITSSTEQHHFSNQQNGHADCQLCQQQAQLRKRSAMMSELEQLKMQNIQFKGMLQRIQSNKSVRQERLTEEIILLKKQINSMQTQIHTRQQAPPQIIRERIIQKHSEDHKERFYDSVERAYDSVQKERRSSKKNMVRQKSVSNKEILKFRPSSRIKLIQRPLRPPPVENQVDTSKERQVHHNRKQRVYVQDDKINLQQYKRHYQGFAQRPVTGHIPYPLPVQTIPVQVPIQSLPVQTLQQVQTVMQPIQTVPITTMQPKVVFVPVGGQNYYNRRGYMMRRQDSDLRSIYLQRGRGLRSDKYGYSFQRGL